MSEDLVLLTVLTVTIKWPTNHSVIVHHHCDHRSSFPLNCQTHRTHLISRKHKTCTIMFCLTPTEVKETDNYLRLFSRTDCDAAAGLVKVCFCCSRSMWCRRTFSRCSVKCGKALDVDIQCVCIGRNTDELLAAYRFTCILNYLQQTSLACRHSANYFHNYKQDCSK